MEATVGGRRGFLALAMWAAVLTPGCHSLDKPTDLTKGPPPPTGTPVEVSTFWQSKIYMLPDPGNNGAKGPGLIGRVFLFSPDLKPISCEGELDVELYDDQYERYPGSKGPVKIEIWKIDKVTLNKLIQKDDIGWGYTLFLPTDRCTPNVTRVHLMVRFTPDHGHTLYSQSNTMKVIHEDPNQPSRAAVVTYQKVQTAPPVPGVVNLSGPQNTPAQVAPPSPTGIVSMPGQPQPVMPVGPVRTQVIVTPAARALQEAAPAPTPVYDPAPPRQPASNMQPAPPYRQPEVF
jgi:hypothetical protein